MKILLAGYGNIGKAFIKLVEKYGCTHEIVICDPIYNNEDAFQYMREHHAEIDLVINLTGLRTKLFLDLVLKYNLSYVDTGIENDDADISSYDYYKQLLELNVNTKVLLGFGMNPGIVEHIYFKNRPGKPHIAAVFETDTATKGQQIFNTWSCESYYLEACVNNKYVSTPKNPYIVVDCPPVHFAVEDKERKYLVIPHEEVFSIQRLSPLCDASLFIYQAPVSIQEYLLNNKISEAQLKSLKTEMDVTGTEKVGILMYDYSDNLVYYYNAVSHQEKFAEFNTNATCWQTACGVYLGMEMIEVVEDGTVATVSDLSVKYPDQIDAVLKKLDFVIDTTEHYVAKEEFEPFLCDLKDQSGQQIFPSRQIWPICDEQQYIFSVNEAIPSIPMKIFFSLMFTKSFTPNELSYAVEKSIETADVFGARFVAKDSRTYMEFMPYQKRDIPVFDFATTEEYQIFYYKVAETEINNRDKLYHIFIFSIAGSCYHLHFCFNHLIFDGISAPLLNDQIRRVLLDKNKEVKWYPYANFLEKIHRYNNSEKYLQDQVFWENRFSEISKSEYLFPDVIDTEEAPVGALVLQIDKQFKKDLFGYCEDNNFSPHMLIVAVLARTISVKTGKKRFYFEIPIGNRSGADEKNSLGAYVIGPPFIFDFTNSDNIFDALESVKKQSNDYYRHKNFDWNTKIFSEPYEKKYGRYVPQFSFSYFCRNKKPPASFALGHRLHPKSDFLPMTVNILDTVDWQEMTFDYRYWDHYFSEEEVLKIHNEVEASIRDIVQSNTTKIPLDNPRRT
jgi:hypothetical protein